MAQIHYLICPGKLSMVAAQSAGPKASLRWFLGTPAGRNFGATNVIITLEWTNSSFQDTIIYEFQNRQVGAVVAQPGRALDHFWGEAEDRAVVSSNLTDGTVIFY